MSNEISRALVIGGLGRVGRLLARSMRSSGIAVRIVDVQHVGTPLPAEDDYIECDVRSPSPTFVSALQSSDCVCLCLPEALTVSAVAAVLPLMPDGSLWVDTTSVKTAIADELQRALPRCEILSINPMFAPG